MSHVMKYYPNWQYSDDEGSAKQPQTTYTGRALNTETNSTEYAILVRKKLGWHRSVR